MPRNIQEELDAERSGWALPMGLFVTMRNPNTGQLALTGTLGHPADTSGRIAITTHHWMSQRGHVVFAPAISTTPIGTIVDTAFEPLNGIDISIIRMENGFTIWPFNPINGQLLGPFFNFPPPLSTFVRAFPFSGSRWGDVTNPSRGYQIGFPFGAMDFFRMAETNIQLVPDDSGSALININANSVVGTLVGRSRDHTRTYFSISGNYVHHVWPWMFP